MSSNCTNLYYTYTLREYIDGAFIPDTSNRGFPRRITKRERQQDGEGQEYDNSEAYSVELGNAEAIGSFYDLISPFLDYFCLQSEDWVVVFAGANFYSATSDEAWRVFSTEKSCGGGGLWLPARRPALPAPSRRVRCRPEPVSRAALEVPLPGRPLWPIPKGLPVPMLYKTISCLRDQPGVVCNK